MRSLMKNRSGSQVFAAILLVSFGTLLLLVNTGIISVEIKEILVFSYPILFIGIGLKGIVDAFRRDRKRRKGLFLPIFLLLVGTLLMLSRFGVLHFTLGMIWRLWPLLLIYFGMEMLVASKRSKGKGRIGNFPIGDVKYNEPNWAVEPLDLINGIGDYYLDFSRAFIPDKEIPIRISGWIGDVKIIVPADLEFSMDIHAGIGDIRVLGKTQDGIAQNFSFKTAGFNEATRRITFDIELKIGDIRLDSV